jgi:hypothetical protein
MKCFRLSVSNILFSELANLRTSSSGIALQTLFRKNTAFHVLTHPEGKSRLCSPQKNAKRMILNVFNDLIPAVEGVLKGEVDASPDIQTNRDKASTKTREERNPSERR